jgi:hypothetical protein
MSNLKLVEIALPNLHVIEKKILKVFKKAIDKL